MTDETLARTFLPDGAFQCINCHSTLPPQRRSEPSFLKPLPSAPFGGPFGRPFGRPVGAQELTPQAPAAKYEITQRRFLSMQQLGGSLRDRYIVERTTQSFDLVATEWEGRFSVIMINGNGFMPIVDENLTVVGHLYDSTKMGAAIYVAGVEGEEGVEISADKSHAIMTIERLNEMLENEDAIAYIDKKSPPGPFYRFHQNLQPGNDLLGFCGLDGRLFEVIRGRGRPGAEVESFNLDDLLIVTMLVKLGIKLGARLITAAAKKVGGLASKIAMSGAGKAIGEFFAKKAAQRAAAREAKMLFKGLKLSRGYHPDMGIAEEHLAKMIKAAKETRTIAIFRANKKAAIPLVRQGAHGKPMWAKFKTKEKTGVLTAETVGERMTAYENGAFVVHPDTVARRTARRVSIRNGKEFVEEIPLAKMDKWTVEPGQVVKADGKPIVGDYDLLGAAPLEAPGRNISLVPENTAYGDWNGPVARNYAKAVNAELKEPMVLHGPQDAYGGDPKYMGLTNDTAYAVFPDGRTFMMHGRAEQQAFYDAMGRAAKSPGAPVGVPGWKPTVIKGGKP